MNSQKRFEDLMKELETTVTDLDSSLGLEESLKKFEHGMTIAQEAEKRLKTIENQFQTIQQQFSSENLPDDTTENDLT